MVWGIEQALFHVYHNWRESDFLLPSFEKWVADTLALPQLAKSLEVLRRGDSYSEQLFGFLSAVDYLTRDMLDTLQTQVTDWEADNQQGLLNSRAARLFNQGKRVEALALFKQAHEQDETNWPIMLNYAQALIESDQTEQGFKYITKAEIGLASTGQTDAKVWYLYAKVCRKLKNIDQALDYINRAIEADPINDHYYELATLQMLTRRFDDAIATLALAPQRDFRYYQILADTYARGNDYPGAIKTLNEAHLKYDPLPESLVRLAKYYRRNYEPSQAQRTLERITYIDQHPLARIELAKVKKALGKLYEYQKIMDAILTEAKQDYRNQQ